MRVSYCASAAPTSTVCLWHDEPGTIMATSSPASWWRPARPSPLEDRDRATRCGGRIDPGRDLPNLPHGTAPRSGIPRDEARGVRRVSCHFCREGHAYPEGWAISSRRWWSRSRGSACGPSVQAQARRYARSWAQDRSGSWRSNASAGRATQVYVSETNPARRKVAEILGAQAVFHPGRTDVVKEIVKRTGIGADVAFECAGARPTSSRRSSWCGWRQVVVVALAGSR